MPASRWLAVVAGAWLCAGCAGPSVKFPDLPEDEVKAERHRQQVAQIKDYFGALARLDNVAFHIKTANAIYCDKQAAQLGLDVATAQSLPRKYRSFSTEALQIGWSQPTVISVADGSPAALAGIKVGDEILTVGNEPVPARYPAEWIASRLQEHSGPVTVMIRRDGKDVPHTLSPVMGCAIPVLLASDPTPGAFTDSRKIVVQSGILRVTKTDTDLAVVVGHELAHVTMGHHGKQLVNGLLGGVSGAVIDGGLMMGGIYTGATFSRHLEVAGEHAFSVAFEREADYVGAYYAARAGYDITGVENVWRAMALESPDSIRLGKTHPTTPVRFVQMQKTIAEIADKQRRHLPLEPDLKQAAPPAPDAY